MEHDKSPTTQSTLASTGPDEFTFKETEHLKTCMQDRIRQLQSEICNVESKIKSFERSGSLGDDCVKDGEQKQKSLKIQENELKSQFDNLVFNMNLLEDATLELTSSISKINNIKENVRYCFNLRENSESSSTNLITGSGTKTKSVLDNKQDDDSTSEGRSHNAVSSLITLRFHSPNKKARLNFDNENSKGGCQNSDDENGTATDHEKEGIGNKLCQDELELIFKQSFITTADLLNFRCVNSPWRDAATSILLIRDSCQLNLELKSIPEPEEHKQKIVYCKRHPFKILPLMDILPIIQASRKFPTTSLSFIENSTLQETSDSIFRGQPELLQFFALYGKFIKSVFIGRTMPEIELLDLLSQYTPNLECLSFQSLEYVSGVIRSNLFSHPTSASDREIWSSLKVISTGPLYTIGEESKRCSLNFGILLDMASNLQSIKNVPLELTKILVEESKVHLLKELNFAPRYNDYDDDDNTKMIKTINDLVVMNPKLSVLTVDFADVTNNSYNTVIFASNSLLESSKDTLECFKITINLYDFPRKIRIPIMKNLNCIKFTETNRRFTRLNEREGPFFEFPEATFGHELFPNLCKVELDAVSNFVVDRTLMRFFPYSFGNRQSFRDNCVPSVNYLKVSLRKWPSLSNAMSICRLFPNIRSLTLEIDPTFGRNLKNSVWLFCPLAESAEIIVGKSNPEYLKTHDVDSFFTGFPSKLCAKLQISDSPLNYNNDKKIIEFLRVMPSICDLKYMKFLTVRFLKLTRPFISMVSCLYAFEQIPEIKVTFTCDSNVGISDRKKIKSCLYDVADFVNVDLDVETTLDDVMLDCDSSTEEDSDEDIHTDIDTVSDTSSTSSSIGDDDNTSIDSLSD